MPIYYSSILQEHRCVRTRVGVFDVSHLGHLELNGPKAVEQANPLVTQDLTRLEVGRAVYTPMLNEKGCILDEMIFYRLGPDRIRLVVNASNADKIKEWVGRRLGPGCELADLRRSVGTLAVQGPEAVPLLERLAGISRAETPRYSARQVTVAGRPVWLARTGYTGEDGFEIFAAVDDLTVIWETLLEGGRSVGIQPIGLGARDTLRLEAGLPLGGSDLDEQTTPLEAGLEWTVRWDKGPFIGREVLERQRKQGIKRRLAGFRLTESGIPRHGYPIFHQDQEVGQVTSGTFLPEGAGAIGLGYLPPIAAVPGVAIAVLIHGRKVPAKVAALPFYRRKR